MLNFGESVSRTGNRSSSSSVYDYPRRTTNVTRPGYDQRINCSQQSVLTAIERFVKAVDDMEATVLVPSRLHDMELQNRRKTSLPPPGMQQHQDLYNFYNMLKDVKNELLWGPSSSPSLFPVSTFASGMSSPRRLPMMAQIRQLSFRQSSDDGLGSSTGCSSDQDTDSDFESIATDRDSMLMMEQTSHLANAFRHHLHGLHAILHQLADSADFLSARYQEEVDTPMK